MKDVSYLYIPIYTRLSYKKNSENIPTKESHF